MKQTYHPDTFTPWSLRRSAFLFFAIGFGVVGLGMLAFSSAATNYSPVGFADSCALENNKTVIYGWGADSSAEARSNSKPDVRITVGSQTYTVPTDRSGYRDAQINSFLKSYGYEPSSIYGFRAEFSNLYKGSAPSISGILLNAGGSNDGGSNQSLRINDSSSVDNSGLPYFTHGRVPDACLANAPLPPPSPNPAPAPTPITTSPAPKPTTSPSSPSTPAPTSTTTPQDTDINEFTAVFTLTDSSQPLVGVVVSIDTITGKSTTDDKGVVSFSKVPAGDYRLIFDYEGEVYEYPFVLGSSTENPAISNFKVDISELTPNQVAQLAPKPSANQKKNNLIVYVALTVLLIAITVFVLRLRKRHTKRVRYQPLDLPSLPQHSPRHHGQEKSAEELDNLVGVSLKELVLKSMQEEAERRKNNHQD